MPNNFPTRAPFGLILGVVLGLASIVPILGVSYSRQRPVQKFYFGEYVASDLSQTPVGAVAAFFRHSQDHTYYVLIQNGQRVSGHGPIPGAPISVQVFHGTDPSEFHAWLRDSVFGGRDLLGLLSQPLELWLIAVIFFASLGSLVDFQRRKRAREGQKLRGGDLMSVDQFNRVTRGDGFALYVQK
jgi:hypothetical protein